MATYLRVQDGVAVEEWSEPQGVTIDQCFTSEMVALFQPKGSAEVGWIWNGSKFSAPVVAPVTSDDLYAYAANKRYAVETGGIIADGYKVSTSRESQSLVTGAYNYVQANPSVMVKFKARTGFVELTAAQMTAIANAVGAHVQAAFAVEAALQAEISSGTIESVADIDAASWPTNG